MDIIWTRLALTTYSEILENLAIRWTLKEQKAFKTLTNETLNKIQQNTILYPIINKKLGIYKAVIHKNVSLFFKVLPEHNQIILITFFNNRMNPKSLLKLLEAH